LQVQLCKCAQFALGETCLQNVAPKSVTGVSVVAELAFFSLGNVLFDDVPNCQSVHLDACNRVSAAPRDDLSSFRRGLMEREAMHAISVDEIIGASENFLSVARNYSPPD